MAFHLVFPGETLAVNNLKTSNVNKPFQELPVLDDQRVRTLRHSKVPFSTDILFIKPSRAPFHLVPATVAQHYLGNPETLSGSTEGIHTHEPIAAKDLVLWCPIHYVVAPAFF